MVRAFWLVLLTPIVVAVGLAPPAGAEPAPQPDTPAGLRLGVLKGMFRDVPPVVIQAAADPFRTLFKKQTGLDGSVEVFDDHDTLAAKMKDKKIDFGVFHGFEFAWIRECYPQLQGLVVTLPRTKPQACLVVHVNSKVDEPARLKGECVAIPTGTKAHCHMFLNHIRSQVPAGNCCPTKKDEGWTDDVLDAVAAETATAALVDVGALAAYQDQKPGVAGQLRVLCKSEPFPPTVVVYRKDTLDAAVVAKIRDGLVGAKNTSEGRAFMMLWKLKGFEDVSAAYETHLEQTLKAYPPPPTK